MIKDGLKKKRDLTDIPKKRFDNHVDSGFLAEMLAGICGLTQCCKSSPPLPFLLAPRNLASCRPAAVCRDAASIARFLFEIEIG